jgi:hypothetical protein
MKKVIINPENPNGLYVDMTAEEIATHEESMANSEAERQAKQQAKTQKEADALAGNNKLLELGLTQAEATALTGYTPPTEV